jgi:hypothetical protein
MQPVPEILRDIDHVLAEDEMTFHVPVRKEVGIVDGERKGLIRRPRSALQTEKPLVRKEIGRLIETVRVRSNFAGDKGNLVRERRNRHLESYRPALSDRILAEFAVAKRTPEERIESRKPVKIALADQKRS